MASIHRRFDIERWRRVFTLEAARQGVARTAWPDGEVLCGPRSVALLEALRDEAGGAGTLGPGVPVDVFVWGLGEPEHRAATKVGGVPYRPADAPWPQSHEGGNSAFIGQICFADSREVLRDERGRAVELPGDVLLVFSPDPSGVWDGDDENPESLQYEWYPLGLSNLVETTPEQNWINKPIRVCHAELHRTMDFPEFPEGHPICEHYWHTKLCVTEGGKIGGVPFYSGSDEPRPGAFLGALGSINPVQPEWPLVNVPAGGDLKRVDVERFLMFGDMGSLYMFQDVQGLVKKRPKLRWAVKGS